MRRCHTEIRRFQNNEVRLSNDERKNMRARRDSNRRRLKAGLARDEAPKPVGCHTQGSYAMHTMVQDGALDYDIDDGIYFEADKLVGPRGAPMSALDVRQMVCDALQDNRFNDAPELRKNCVRIYYTEGFHVDVPAYRRSAAQNAWTGKTEYAYELASAQWKASDPRAVTKWFHDTNTQLSPNLDDEGQFRRIVRLLKVFARSRETWKGKTASGFMITKLAAEVFHPADGQDDVSLRQTMIAIERRLNWNKVIDHPVLQETLTKNDDGQPEFFREKLSDNLNHLKVLDRTDCSHDEAMAAWDKVFYTDWFSQQPPPKDTGGSGSGKGPSSPVEKAGGGRFA